MRCVGVLLRGIFGIVILFITFPFYVLWKMLFDRPPTARPSRGELYRRCVLLTIFLTPGICFAATEDLTTWTETDASSKLTVTSSTAAFANTMGSTANITKDYGASHFGDFEHLFQAKISERAINGAANPWAMGAASTGTEFRVDFTATTTVYLWAGLSNDSYSSLTAATDYYYKVKRAGSTLYLYIYSDSGRSTLVDTLSVSCATTAYRWLTMLGSGGFGNTTFYSKDLDLQEGAASTIVLGFKGMPTSVVSAGTNKWPGKFVLEVTGTDGVDYEFTTVESGLTSLSGTGPFTGTGAAQEYTFEMPFFTGTSDDAKTVTVTNDDDVTDTLDVVRQAYPTGHDIKRSHWLNTPFHTAGTDDDVVQVNSGADLLLLNHRGPGQ